MRCRRIAFCNQTHHGASLGYISNDLVVCTYVHALKNKASKSPKKCLLLDSHIGMLTTDLETDDSLSAAVYQQKIQSNTTSMLC
jgi:hypothetical protein